MKQIFISALYLLTVFCLAHFVFEPAYLYYEIWWLDIPMHIMGGFGVTALVHAVLTYRHIESSFWKLFFAYMLVATVWEIYEYIASQGTLLGWSGWFDTIKDYIDGFIGMSVAYFLLKK